MFLLSGALVPFATRRCAQIDAAQQRSQLFGRDLSPPLFRALPQRHGVRASL